MVRFFKFKFLLTLKLSFIGRQFIKKYQNLVISKRGKSHTKIVKLQVALLSICVIKFEVENVEYLH